MEYNPNGARPGALAAVGRCLQAQTSCEGWATEVPDEACWDEARRSVEPNEVVIDYCESSSLHGFECGAWWSVDDCLETVNIWADSVLQEAMLCHHLECEEMFRCEAAVWERY